MPTLADGVSQSAVYSSAGSSAGSSDSGASQQSNSGIDLNPVDAINNWWNGVQASLAKWVLTAGFVVLAILLVFVGVYAMSKGNDN